MNYILSEEEFKQYRLCRAEIIKLYNGFIDLLNDKYKGDQNIYNKMSKYANILEIEAGNKYEGI